MLAQVHNALGFAYFNMERTELALKNYAKAVELQPGYVTAWNNLGDAQEKAKDWEKVLPSSSQTHMRYCRPQRVSARMSWLAGEQLPPPAVRGGVLMGLVSRRLKAYEEALSYSPENKVARSRAESLRSKVGRINMTS